jgi:hypothetical protein
MKIQQNKFMHIVRFFSDKQDQQIHSSAEKREMQMQVLRMDALLVSSIKLEREGGELEGIAEKATPNFFTNKFRLCLVLLCFTSLS